MALAKHLTAERKTEEFLPGKGVIVKWERVHKNNHWFDALYNACAAAHYCDVRLVGEKVVKRERKTLMQLAADADAASRRVPGIGDR